MRIRLKGRHYFLKVFLVLLTIAGITKIILWVVHESNQFPLSKPIPRLLCWVPTGAPNKRNKAVRDTWGKRCHKLIFFTPKNDKVLGETVVLDGVEEGMEHLWGKTRAALLYLYQHHLEAFDYFLKADDDTFVIVENLLHFISHNFDSPDDPAYFGQRFKSADGGRIGFMSGGPGYVLSRGALRRFAEEGFRGGPGQTVCLSRTADFGEDAAVGDCMKKLGVPFGDTRDSHGRGRFFHTSVAASLTQDDSWEHFKQFFHYWAPEGRDCCSSDAISFHRMSPEEMIAMDYLIYDLKIHDV